jgi:hypothetical protein
MSEFWIYFDKGLRHIFNLFACSHILFLIALAAPYAFKEWKRLLFLVSLFTIGHTLAVLLSVFGIILIKGNLIDFLIPITILLVAFFNIFNAGKSSKNPSSNLVGFVTLFFGILHGLGFSGYFKSVLESTSQSKALPILEFALGIMCSQLLVVFVVLLLSYSIQTIFRFSKRDWILMLSSFVFGVVLPMIIANEIWSR